MESIQTIVCGIDEAGRGALAGPLVAAAVIFPKKSIKTVSRRVGFKARDSKTLSELQRKKIYAVLKRMRVTIAVEILSALQINHHGMGWANREIMRRLIKRMTADVYIADGNMKLGRIPGKTAKMKSVINADATVPEVICAGVVAKVERDKIMHLIDREFPQFHWKSNEGYGTKYHLEALRVHPMTKHHRPVYVTTALGDKTPA